MAEKLDDSGLPTGGLTPEQEAMVKDMAVAMSHALQAYCATRRLSLADVKALGLRALALGHAAHILAMTDDTAERCQFAIASGARVMTGVMDIDGREKANG